MKKHTVIADTGIIIAGKRYAKGDTVELATGAILEAALRFKQVEPAVEDKDDEKSVARARHPGVVECVGKALAVFGGSPSTAADVS